ncbi:MAG: hypothetical protein ACHQNA_04815 [Acidimicrobiales bacterium]
MRSWLGLALAAIGGLLLWLGWYDVSGETLVARQLPYLASASMPGAALLVAGAVLVGSEIARRASEQSEELVATMYQLFTEAGPPGDGGAGGPATDTRLVTVTNGTRYHRPSCLLIEGKPDLRTVDADEIARLDLQPCPVCSPPAVGA